MRPKTFNYTLSALDADGYLDDATGAGPWTTILAQPSDGLAHPVTHTSSSDQQTINFTLTGTDANGNVISEVLAGGSTGAVTSVLLYKTITSVSASATISTNTFDLGWTAVADSKIIPVDRFQDTGAMVLADIGATIAYSLWQTNMNVYDAVKNGTAISWVLLGSAGATADQGVVALAGGTAVKFTVASHTSGTVALTVSQNNS